MTLRTARVMTAAVLGLASMLTTAHAADTSKSPVNLTDMRPPAVPLVTTDPYLSIWSFNDRLTDADTHHWTGKTQTLLSLVRVDGKPFRLAGVHPAAVPAMDQKSVEGSFLALLQFADGSQYSATGKFTAPLCGS